MRVLHVLGELRASGGEVMLRDAVEALSEQGIETVVLSTGDRLGDFASEYHRLGVRTLHLPFKRNGSFAVCFWRLTRTANVDVVHVHTERANAVLGLASRLAGKRVVRTVHNVFSYSGRLRLIRMLERAVLRAIGVRHVSIGPAVELNERERLRNTTVRVDNWISPRFRPPMENERGEARRRYNLDPTAIAVTTIGNCSRVKNHLSLLEALPGVACKLNRPIVYLHAGSGAAEPEERALANTVLPTSVEARFLGTVADVRPLLWASDVYCMPSLYEGVPIAALEALACGIPAVLADVAGLRDVHPPAASVRFVEPSSTGVASAIVALMMDIEAVSRATSTVASAIRSQRDMKKQVRALVGAYRSR